MSDAFDTEGRVRLNDNSSGIVEWAALRWSSDWP